MRALTVDDRSPWAGLATITALLLVTFPAVSCFTVWRARLHEARERDARTAP